MSRTNESQLLLSILYSVLCQVWAYAKLWHEAVSILACIYFSNKKGTICLLHRLQNITMIKLNLTKKGVCVCISDEEGIVWTQTYPL